MDGFPGKDKTFETTVLREFVVRSRAGVWGQLLCLLLVLSTTSLPARLPALMRSYAVLVIGLAGLRYDLLRRMARPGQVSALLQRGQLTVVLGSAALAGIMPGVAMYRFGYDDKDVLSALLYHGVLAFAMVGLFVHERRLIWAVVALMFAPLITGNLLHGGPGPWHYLEAAAVYIAYCLVQGSKMHVGYRQHLTQSDELAAAAYRDCLTGLPNRLYMDQQLETHVSRARQSGTTVALLYIDIDGLKQINDQHSHKAGDLFLREAAHRIRDGVEGRGLAARIGGDEFTVLMPSIESPADALELAQALLEGTAVPMHLEGVPFRYSASIGVSFFPMPSGDAEGLMRFADEALRNAKSTGRNRICVRHRSGMGRVLPGPHGLRVMNAMGREENLESLQRGLSAAIESSPPVASHALC